ncbi:hypothetical protein LO80_07040 [Candidatus Francisella endociliophora]|uniref:GDSL family lipase n=1 Tax=Candidatus Francisella endociliophora TaxID=653937 RepID=A0A097EQ95_9GAMM|nr:SGNH/GDSL hydrolase family protein [Francisella sp. FSC1006]AIT09743.1 hypothetical protein LO80_07040 [Francisella sp. FSC1006]
MKKILLKIGVALSVPLFGGALNIAETNNVVVFGDSLSDVGYYNNLANIWQQKQQKPWPKTIDGKNLKQPTFSTPVINAIWSQKLDKLAGIKLTTNNLNTPKMNAESGAVVVDEISQGNNYAAGGATTTCDGISVDGVYTPPPIGPSQSENCEINKYNQIDSYLSQHDNQANPNTVYLIWGGANNAFILLSKVASGTISPEEASKGMVDAANDIIKDIEYLQSKGAEKLIVLALPNLKITPAMTDDGKEPDGQTAQLAQQMSNAFNNKLKVGLSDSSDVIFLRDDLNFFDKIVTHKRITVNDKEYLFNDVTQSACDFAGDNSLSCVPKDGTEKYLFADTVHPTNHAQQALAEYIYRNGISKFSSDT